MHRRTMALVMCLVLPMAVLGAQAKPTAEITKFTLDKISLQDITFGFELNVKNPYPLELSFSGMSLDFVVEKNTVFQTQSQGGFKVPANRTMANSFTVTLTYESILKVVKSYAEKDWLDTEVKGTLTIPLPVAIPGLGKDITFNYSLKQKIPALKPSVEIRGFQVKGPSAKDIETALSTAAKKADPVETATYFADLAMGKKPKKAPLKPSDLDVPFTISFTLALKNGSKATLGFQSLDYSLTLGGEALVTGSSSQVKKEGSTTLITVDNTFSSKKLSEGIQSLLAAKKGNFRITGSTQLQVPTEVRKTPLPLAFDESGSFQF